MELQPLHASHQTLLDELQARQEQVLRQLEELEERIRRTLQEWARETAPLRDPRPHGS